MYRNDLIAEGIKKLHLSPEKFAEIIGSTGFTVRRAMSGGRVEIATLHLIAAGLGLEIKQLFDGVPTKAEPSSEVAKKLEKKSLQKRMAPLLFDDKKAA